MSLYIQKRKNYCLKYNYIKIDSITFNRPSPSNHLHNTLYDCAIREASLLRREKTHMHKKPKKNTMYANMQ